MRSMSTVRLRSRPRCKAVLAQVAVGAFVVALVVSLFSVAAASADETVDACVGQDNYAFTPSDSNSGQFTMPLACPLEITTTGGAMGKGTSAHWEADAPSGLTIVRADVSLISEYVNDGSAGQYGGGFYWSGGGGALITPSMTSFSTPAGFASPTFGFFIVCGKSTCTQPYGNITMNWAQLTVRETVPPTVYGSLGLWEATGWVRGNWPLIWGGDSPSGVCTLRAALAGQELQSEATIPDGISWKQCRIPYGEWLGDQVATGDYPNGADRLTIGATDAAGRSATASETVHIDNETPRVTFSGPTDAPSSAGTQYVTAEASAGPSGVYGIDCSVDGGVGHWYPAGTAQLPVTDSLGPHHVSCYSESNAVDLNGVHGTSPMETFTMKIGAPTVSVVGFSRLVDGLVCRRVTERVRIPGRWVTVRTGHRRIRVYERAHTQRVRVTRCHVRTRRRRITVWVTVIRHGRRVRVRRHRIVRVLLRPHLIRKTTRTVRHGHGTTVDGWVGTTAGVALAGQTVQVFTAADNGRNNYHLAATATTKTNGTWSARLGPGPSRLIRAYYPGASTTQAAQSKPATLVVPAKIKLLAVSPRRVRWGGRVRITGRLLGGYLPPGGALVRLRIGYGSAYTTYGVKEHVGGHGRFETTYTFGLGQPSVHRRYWFQVASLPMGDYPWAPAASRRVPVSVGG